MPQQSVDTHWSDDIETVLGSIYESCTFYAHSHKKRYFYLKGYLKYFRIPTIIISGVNSVCSVGLQPYVAQKHISILTCILALICGIITSMELYLQIQASMESDLMAAKDFLLLAADIYKMMTLDRENRGVGGISYLEEKFGIYCKYIEGSQLLDRRMPNILRLNNPRDSEQPSTTTNQSGTSRDSSNGNGTGSEYDSEDNSLYSTTRRRSAAFALGMTEPLMSALRLSRKNSASIDAYTKIQQPSHELIHQPQQQPQQLPQQQPLNDAEIAVQLHHQNVMDSLWRVHDSELVPSEITLDALEKGGLHE